MCQEFLYGPPAVSSVRLFASFVRNFPLRKCAALQLCKCRSTCACKWHFVCASCLHFVCTLLFACIFTRIFLFQRGLRVGRACSVPFVYALPSGTHSKAAFSVCRGSPTSFESPSYLAMRLDGMRGADRTFQGFSTLMNARLVALIPAGRPAVILSPSVAPLCFG